MNKELYHDYIHLIKNLKETFGLHADVEHEHIHTMIEGKIEKFKLIYGTFQSDNKTAIVVSFHLDLDPAEAIQWYEKVLKFFPDITITESYFKDDAGETFLGQDAQVIRFYKEEQRIISGFLESTKSKEDLKEYVDSKILGRVRDHKKLYINIDEALSEFYKMGRPVDDDESH